MIANPDEREGWWAGLDKVTQERLYRTWCRGDHETYRVMRDQAVMISQAQRRSAERGARRQRDIFNDKAAKAGLSPKDIHDFWCLDGLPDDVRDQLLDLQRKGDLCAYATALGLARQQAASEAQ